MEKDKNLRIYEEVRTVPDEAKKSITGGRLKGMTDINPMWRIKKLTEVYGPCGTGWKYAIKRMWTEKGGNYDVSAFVEIDLFVNENGTWSEAIPGIGGSSFVTNEKNGLYTSDECYKMALTDAISVSCKALGFAADVYFDKDKTKYDDEKNKKPLDYKDKPLIDAVIDYMEKDNEYKVNIFTHYSISDYSQLTDEMIKSIAVSIRKKGVLI